MMENKKGGRRDPDCDKCSTVAEECSVTSTVAAPTPSGCEFRPNAPKFGTVVPNRIFVGGIPDTVTVGELEHLFSRYGRVTQAKIIVDRGGVPKGYGFITFETDEEARNVQMDSNVMLREKRLNIAPAIRKQMAERIYPSLASPILINPEPPMSSIVGGGVDGQMNGGVHADSNNFQVAPTQFMPRRDETSYFVPPMQYPFQGPMYHTLPNGPESSPQLMFPGYQGSYSNVPIQYQNIPFCYAPITHIPNDTREAPNMGPPFFHFSCMCGPPVSPTTPPCHEAGSGSEASFYEPSDSYSANPIIYYYNVIPPPTHVQPNPQHNLLAINEGSTPNKDDKQDLPPPSVTQVASQQATDASNVATDQAPTAEKGPTPLMSATPIAGRIITFPSNEQAPQQPQTLFSRPSEETPYNMMHMRGRGRGRGGMRRGSGNGGVGGRSFEQSINNNSSSYPNNYECDKKKVTVDSFRGGRGGIHSYHPQSNPRPTNNFPRPPPIFQDRPRPSNIRFFQNNYNSNNSLDTNRFFPGFGGANRRGYAGRARWNGNPFSRGNGGRYGQRGYGKMRPEHSDEGVEYEDSERGHGVDEFKTDSTENGVLTPPITPRSPRAGSPENFTTTGTSSASDVDVFNESMSSLAI